MPLIQQKIVTQTKALDIVMKLEASPVGETRVGVDQIQLELENAMIQLQDIKKGKKFTNKCSAPDVAWKDIIKINARTSATTCIWVLQIH